MTVKGKALVWLHKTGDGRHDFEHHINFLSCSEEGYWFLDDAQEVSSYRAEDAFGDRLKKMAVGDWVRFTIKWDLHYSSWYDHWSGATEYDVEWTFEYVKTLRKGHCPLRYISKDKQ